MSKGIDNASDFRAPGRASARSLQRSVMRTRFAIPLGPTDSKPRIRAGWKPKCRFNAG